MLPLQSFGPGLGARGNQRCYFAIDRILGLGGTRVQLVWVVVVAFLLLLAATASVVLGLFACTSQAVDAFVVVAIVASLVVTGWGFGLTHGWNVEASNCSSL
jgi:hypothetical protein